MSSITACHGTYTQNLVHRGGKPSSEDAWKSAEELMKMDELLWKGKNSKLRSISFQARENDAAAKTDGMQYILESY